MILELSLMVMMIASGFYLWRTFGRIQNLNQKCVKLHYRLREQIKKNAQLKQEFHHLEEQFSQNVLTDALTGLPSRKIFEDHLTLAVNQSQRHQLTCAIMFLDIDSFKIINEALGYDVGDALLREVAKRLETCVRQVDTLSRFAGDEFVFIFSQINKAETAVYIAQRLLDCITQPFLIQTQEIYLAASIGIAIFPTDGNDGKTLLKNADIALGQAKLRGPNTYQFYQQEMQALSHRELMLSSCLHNKINFQQFNIYYQPRVNLTTKKITCMDAILQWQHPDFGLVTFQEFSRLAEKNNNMAIYEWWMRNACQDLMKWRESDCHSETVSVKISLKQLENKHFIQKIAAILQETKLEPSSLVFELTENSLLTKMDLVEKMLHMLNRMGVKIALNNFGASHLQLQYLRHLPIDIFKIDRSLVFDIDTNRESEAIVTMISSLARNLRAEVIAEGVDNVNQKNALLALGCSIMQGELFSPLILAKDFRACPHSIRYV